jgi:hypothetical protein
MVLAVLAIAGAGPAGAEVIELVDRTKMNGTIIHYYEGVYSVQTGGQTIKIPKDKIKAITFKLPAPRPEFSSATKTFERWRQAVATGQLEKAVECYALMFQGMLALQIAEPEGIKEMQKEIEGTKFTIESEQAKGDKATLKVSRRKGEDAATGDIAFVRENGEWKMLPPQ